MTFEYFSSAIVSTRTIHYDSNFCIYFSSGPRIKQGQIRALNRDDPKDDLVLIVGLGKKDQITDSNRQGHDLSRESIRTGISLAVRSLKDQGLEEVLVDDCGDEEAAAEGAHLALWAYDFLKAKKESLRQMKVKPLTSESGDQWDAGVKKAEGQNLARTFMETPANYMTPQLFAKVLQQIELHKKIVQSFSKSSKKLLFVLVFQTRNETFCQATRKKKSISTQKILFRICPCIDGFNFQTYCHQNKIQKR